jgi:hypothetical protein
MIDIILWTQPVDGVLRLNSDRCQEEHQNKEKLLFHDNSIVCVIWITFVMYRIVHTFMATKYYGFSCRDTKKIHTITINGKNIFHILHKELIVRLLAFL